MNEFAADFAVGAPFADEGKGAVYIYHGAASPDELKIEPVQVVIAHLATYNSLLIIFCDHVCFSEIVRGDSKINQVVWQSANAMAIKRRQILEKW